MKGWPSSYPPPDSEHGKASRRTALFPSGRRILSTQIPGSSGPRAVCGTRPLRPSWCPEGRNSPVSAESHSPGYGRTLRMLALSAAYSSSFPASVAAYISVQKRLISRRKIRSEKHHLPGTQRSRQEASVPSEGYCPRSEAIKAFRTVPPGSALLSLPSRTAETPN